MNNKGLDKTKKRFTYKVKNEKGKTISGFLDAYDQKEVAEYLKNEGYIVTKINQASFLDMNLGSKKMKYSELIFMITQLSTYLKAGIPLIDSMKILEKQTKKKDRKAVYSNVIYELSKGENFSDALNSQNKVFPSLLINMVKTAEATGDLPEVLEDMRDYYTSIDKTRKEAVSAMIYPSILFIFAIAVLVFILAHVIPSFVKLFEQQNADLPRITKTVLALSSFLTSNRYLIVGILLLTTVLLIVLYKTVKPVKRVMQVIAMKTPIIGKTIIYREVTTFTKTFASLLNHSVFITDSMEILKNVSNNEIYKEIINDSLDKLSKGARISDAFEDKWAFPTVAHEMLLTGESTGKLPMMMSYVADYFESLHANMVKRLNTFIEPLLIIFIAFIVGVVVVSVILPMFSFYGAVV